MPRFAVRSLLLLGGLLAGAALLEAALRVWGTIEGRRMAEKMVASDPLRRPIVAFCGDSNIYGVYVEQDRTLPACVERLSRAGGGAGLRCVNLGVPGKATWDTLEQQVRVALKAKPAAVVVTCGINDFSIRPATEGLGPLENLYLVKMIRRMIFNYRLRHTRGALQRLDVGPDGKEIAGGAIILDNGNGAVVLVDREGNTQIQEKINLPSELDFAEVAPVARANYATMAAEARSAGSRLVFATYLAGDNVLFEKLNGLMRETAAATGATLADCGAAIREALTIGNESRPSDVPVETLQNRRSMLLTEDFHPTELGYEVEARVVARALKEAGVLPNYAPVDPLAPMREAPASLPSLAHGAADPGRFEISAQAGDRVVLYLGSPGRTRLNSAIVPVDTTKADALRAAHSVGELAAEADARGKATILVPPAFLRALEKPIVAAVVVERFRKGNTRRFLTAPRTLDFRD